MLHAVRRPSTSLVPLSWMPYLSLVFLILSEIPLINFFISYSRGETNQPDHSRKLLLFSRSAVIKQSMNVEARTQETKQSKSTGGIRY
ncbi:hypothetical protein EYF80_005977 [Liparis tanakae]|uniref:Uncharacterized protein n=1 Tax=Liparis tanakae TaxID=230148 RepID=A0A4Z2J1F7_9TELE|nr:hypothetical protein EYF80_005977 [Liparis tanakae]